LSTGTIGLALPRSGVSSDVHQRGSGEGDNPISGVAIEPKRSLSKAQELKIVQDQTTVTVSGETFSYVLSKEHGLIRSIRVLGEELIADRPVPDLMVAEQLDRTFSPYRASNEVHANLTLDSHTPDKAVIRAEGAYTSETGQPFPLRYAVTYEITIDGVILIRVDNRAVRDCSFRWLTLSSGAIRSSSATFMSWMPEQASSQHSKYLFRPLSPAPDSSTQAHKLLAGTFLPWFWLGNARVGLELTTPEVTSQTYNQVDGTSQTNENEMFTVFQQGSEIRWENFLVRGSYTWAKAGWQRSGEFALAITPSKKFDPYYAMIKGGIIGPYQHIPKFTSPDEQQIRTFAQNGYDLMVGLANWRSGEYVPLNEEDLHRTISLCHKYGIKAIPYVTLMDLSHATDAFREYGEEWAIQPTTENFRQTPRFDDLKVEMAYRNDPEQETTLMCPGSPGWRAYWKKQIDRIVEQYDFDGLYFDFWYGNMVCENARHGCGSRFRKFTVLGAREMMSYAYERVKARNPHAIFIANTNLLSTALLTSLIDVRLVGEGGDMAKMDADARQWLYSSYRLGEPTEFLWAKTQWNDIEKVSFATLVNFLPDSCERAQFTPRKGFDDFDVFRYFGAETAEWHLGIQGQNVLLVSPSEVVANVIERPDGILATLINTAHTPIAAEVSINAGRMAYDPLSAQLFHGKDGRLSIEIAGNAHRQLLFIEPTRHPKVLFVLGARKLEVEKWEPQSRTLNFSINAVIGAPLRITLYSTAPIRKITNRNGEPIVFKWFPLTYLAQVETTSEEGDRFEALI
jgi:hypothetical protein